MKMGAAGSEIKKMKRELRDLQKKVDAMMDERLSIEAMMTSERSLSEFFSDEPVIYSEKDLKVKYR
ncbi:MAG: hypothetical protein M1503_13295 [Thaumarchaeota archaeon]|nr:hypothetical protein [Nitrososphaerota archaeon]